MKHLLDNPITYESIIEVLAELSHEANIKFALFCVNKVKHLNDIKEVGDAALALERYLADDISYDEITDVAIALNKAANKLRNKGWHEEFINNIEVLYCARCALHLLHKVRSIPPENEVLAYYTAEWADSAMNKFSSSSHRDYLRQEMVYYAKQLLISELPEELKDNWLLVASI